MDGPQHNERDATTIRLPVLTSARAHAPSSPRPQAEYWRSLEERADSPEFRRWLEAEFPFVPPESAGGPSRRQFLKLAGASLALAGVAACRWPKETIVPASAQPWNRVPGQTAKYASAIELGGVGTGVLVTSYEGRPIKIEGNDKHPFSRGKTNHWMQAAILELYDPDRSASPVQRGADGKATNRQWSEFEAFARQHFGELRAKGGAGLAVLCEPFSSLSLAEMRDRFQQAFPRAKWYEWEPAGRDNELVAALRAFDAPYRLHLHLDQADVIISLDSDFLMRHPAAVKYAGDFAARRRPADGTMNRLYVFESALTVTGSLADERHAVRSCDVGAVAVGLANALAGRVEETEGLPVSMDVLTRIAADLEAHRGRCVVVAGPRQPDWVHTIVFRLNQRLGSWGRIVTLTSAPARKRETCAAALQALSSDISDGHIDTLVMLGGNPAHDAPPDVALAKALTGVRERIHLGLYDNETARLCTWHAPEAHWLESWGDVRAWNGTLSIVQPLIAPLYDGRTSCELLALLCDDPLKTGYEITRRTFRNWFDFGDNHEKLWQQSLHDGVVPNTTWPTVLGPECDLEESRIAQRPAGYEVVFAEDYSVCDGRFANNAWLQEWPDPITKLTWDNAALISPADAEKLGVRKSGDIVRIELHGAALEIPAYILPGHAENSITLPLGYGRGAAAGLVAEGAGFDVNRLRRSDALWIATGAKVTATGGHYPLATTQDHHAIKSAVGDAAIAQRLPVLVREGTLEEYKHHPDFAQHRVHHPPLESLWQEKKYYDHKWGMAIDLNACIGCGACVLACQAENNVPVVGKDEVALGREMHWIRVDRYFKEGAEGARGQGAKGQKDASRGSSDAASIEVVHQPVACVHCENAPCEQVCPVAATVHDEEGLNVMVYNRCVGTRYCSNNCPYKVRRFNWFNNHHGPYHPRSRKAGTSLLPGQLDQAQLTEVEKLGNSPYVTVRSRGVMEKCTFCVQRINQAKITARNERWDKLPDGLITPACAQSCPADAIVFGDLNDPTSRVRKLHDDSRAYALLGELNVKPRTLYLAKLRNPNAGAEGSRGPGAKGSDDAPPATEGQH